MSQREGRCHATNPAAMPAPLSVSTGRQGVAPRSSRELKNLRTPRNNEEDYISLTMYCGWEAEPGPGSRRNGRTGTAQCAQVSPVTEASPSMGCTRAWGLDPVSAGAYGSAATKSMGGPLKSETSRPATVVAIAVPS
jgi:hypothetical protein